MSPLVITLVVLTAVVAVFGFLIAQGVHRTAWWLGALQSHSDMRQKWEFQKWNATAEKDQKVKLVWHDKTANGKPKPGSKHGQEVEPIKTVKIGLPLRDRRSRPWFWWFS